MSESQEVAFSPDGKLLAVTGPGQVINVWDVAGRKLKDTLRGHTGFVTSVAFSPDGATVASASLDWAVKVWDVKTGKVLTTLDAHAAISIE